MRIKEIVQRIFKKEAKVHILLDIDGVLNPIETTMIFME